MISILIIGNEILSAQVEDTNLKTMLARFNQEGYPVDEVRVVRDDMDQIAASVRELSSKSRYLVSTGGIGPTHDDITLEAYALAFNQPLILHPKLEGRIRSYFRDKVEPSSLRMARVPKNTVLADMGSSSWPIIRVENCFILPGLPEVFYKKFEGVLNLLPKVEAFHRAALFTGSDETVFAKTLTDCQAAFPEVEIGSYPTFDRTVYAAKVTINGKREQSVKAVFVRLKAEFTGLGSLVRWEAPNHWELDEGA